MLISTAARFASISLAAALLLGPGVAWAGPHFNDEPVVSGPDSKTGAITVTWTEEGLGTSGNAITYAFSAGPVSFTWQCFTKSGNKPQGAPNSTSDSSDTSTGSFFPNRSGQISGSMSLSPIPAGSCQGGGLKLCLTDAVYENVTFQDVTNQVPPSPGFTFGTRELHNVEIACH
jgi:hypothetical protein